MFELISTFSKWLIPVFIFIVLAHAYHKGIPVYETFVEGATEGFWLAVRLIPYIVGIYVAIGVFRDSGAMQKVVFLLAPLLAFAHVPPEILPLAIIRPLSGPAALGITIDLMETHGPDSYLGLLASTLDGSTDTTLYIIAVYFAAVGVRKVRYALAVGLMADLAGFAGAIYICEKLFR